MLDLVINKVCRKYMTGYDLQHLTVFHFKAFGFYKFGIRIKCPENCLACTTATCYEIVPKPKFLISIFPMNQYL